MAHFKERWARVIKCKPFRKAKTKKKQKNLLVQPPKMTVQLRSAELGLTLAAGQMWQ